MNRLLQGATFPAFAAEPLGHELRSSYPLTHKKAAGPKAGG